MQFITIVGSIIGALIIGGYLAWLMLSNTQAREAAYRRAMEKAEEDITEQAKQLEQLRRQGF
jgi:predicted negative regulator of RcsB-dependent stress response